MTIQAPGGGAGGIFAGGSTTASITTDGSGNASTPIFTANGTAGLYTVQVILVGVTTTTASTSNPNSTITGQTNLTFNYALQNTGGSPSQIAVFAGPPVSNNQSAAIGAPFATQLQAVVTNSAANPVSGPISNAYVAFSASAGTFASGAGNVAIGSNGVAVAAALTAPTTYPAGGQITVTATLYVNSTSTATTTFTLSVLGAGSMSPVALSTPQSTPVNTAFGKPLGVLVLDNSSSPKPLAGATVTFTTTAASNGANGTFTGGVNTITATTNSSGIASAPITANSTAAPLQWRPRPEALPR